MAASSESSASSSPLVRPPSPGQQDDVASLGAALMDMRILELQREQGHTRFFFPEDRFAAQAKPEDEDTFVLIEFPTSSSARVSEPIACIQKNILTDA
jgi:hypothetical protein